MKPSTPKPQFADATEQEILMARDDPESNALLAKELGRILKTYSENCAAYLRKLGKVPESFLQDTPPKPLEGLALSIIREAVAENGNIMVAWHGQKK